MDKRQILVGCNESCVTEAIKIILADSCQVTEQGSYEGVAREACNERFDLVIIYGNCLSPPVLCSGRLLENTLCAIKTIKAARAVPVIALNSMPEWRDLLLAAGADVCLETPFTIAEFRAAVSGCVQRWWPADRRCRPWSRSATSLGVGRCRKAITGRRRW